MTTDRHEAGVAIVGAVIAGIATAIEAVSRGRRRAAPDSQPSTV
ncbi:MAG: hypothetical protein WAW79_05510 [Steroidobacteraceae bacterium]